MTPTYRACKSLVDRGAYSSQEDMQFKLDIFLLNNRLSQSEYEELTSKLSAER